MMIFRLFLVSCLVASTTMADAFNYLSPDLCRDYVDFFRERTCSGVGAKLMENLKILESNCYEQFKASKCDLTKAKEVEDIFKPSRFINCRLGDRCAQIKEGQFDFGKCAVEVGVDFLSALNPVSGIDVLMEGFKNRHEDYGAKERAFSEFNSLVPEGAPAELFLSKEMMHSMREWRWYDITELLRKKREAVLQYLSAHPALIDRYREKRRVQIEEAFEEFKIRFNLSCYSEYALSELKCQFASMILQGAAGVAVAQKISKSLRTNFHVDATPKDFEGFTNSKVVEREVSEPPKVGARAPTTELSTKVAPSNLVDLESSARSRGKSAVLALKQVESAPDSVFFVTDPMTNKVKARVFISQTKEDLEIDVGDVFVLGREQKIDALKVKLSEMAEQAKKDLNFAVENKAVAKIAPKSEPIKEVRATRALERLKALLAKRPGRNVDPKAHAIRENDGRVILDIGYIEAKDPAFLARSLAAIREGSVDAIDAGFVIGPKVPAVISQMLKEAPEGKVLTIGGKINGWDLVQMKESEVLLSQNPTDLLKVEGRYWTDADKVAFDKAIKDLRIDEACQKLWNAKLENCGTIVFRIKSGNPRMFEWARPGKPASGGSDRSS